MRLSYNWSDGFAVRARGNNEGGVNCAQHRVLDRGQLDLSASYTLSSLPSEPQITLNMVNITDEPQHTVLEYDSMMYDYYEPGRTIMLGIRGSF